MKLNTFAYAYFPDKKVSAYHSPIFLLYFDFLLMISGRSLCILNRSIFHIPPHPTLLTSPGFAY